MLGFVLLVLSISRNKAEKEQFPSMQIDCFIPKPVEVGELLKTLEILLLK